MGKSNRKNRKEHFARLVRAHMETDAWRALGSTAQALYPWLLLEWRGSNFNNNGKIQLSVRQAAKRQGVSNNTISKAFHQLEAKGLAPRTGAVLPPKPKNMHDRNYRRIEEEKIWQWAKIQEYLKLEQSRLSGELARLRKPPSQNPRSPKL